MKELALTAEGKRHFLQTVRDDLIFLQSLSFKKPTLTEVRISSSILRRLLYERMYAVGWQVAELDAEPKVVATDLDAMVENVPTKYIHYAYAGGASTEVAQHNGYVLLGIPPEDYQTEGVDAKQREMQRLLRAGLRRNFTLEEFCSSPCVMSGSAAVSRVFLIWYVANKRGGVHWDNRRGEWANPVDARNRLLDEDHLVVGQLPAPLYETLSIAEALATSSDTQIFIDHVAIIAPEEKRSSEVISFREGRIGKYADITFNPDRRDKDS